MIYVLWPYNGLISALLHNCKDCVQTFWTFKINFSVNWLHFYHIEFYCMVWNRSIFNWWFIFLNWWCYQCEPPGLMAPQSLFCHHVNAHTHARTHTHAHTTRGMGYLSSGGLKKQFEIHIPEKPELFWTPRDLLPHMHTLLNGPVMEETVTQKSAWATFCLSFC